MHCPTFYLHFKPQSLSCSGHLWNPSRHHALSYSCCWLSWECSLSWSSYTNSVLVLQIQFQFSSGQSLSRVRLFATPWIAARQASLSNTSCRSLPKLMSIKLVMPSSISSSVVPFSSCPQSSLHVPYSWRPYPLHLCGFPLVFFLNHVLLIELRTLSVYMCYLFAICISHYTVKYKRAGSYSLYSLMHTQSPAHLLDL